MSCPNCRQDLDSRIVDNQTILYCLNCGGSFFEENGINRISVKMADKLARDHSQNIILGYEKQCPKDKTLLSPLVEESIPQNVSLLQCPTCKGVFAYPDDLVRFKKAQSAKINFLSTWSIPPASVKSVLVLTFMAIVSFAAFSGYFLFRQSTTSQAQDVIKNVNVTQSAQLVLISFRSQIPLTTKIIFVDRTINKITQLTVSSTPKILHFVSTSEVNPENEVYFQIVGVDDQGREIKTDGTRLKIGP